MNRCLAAVALCIALAAAPSSVRAEQYEKADIYVELRGIALSLAQDQRGIEPAAGSGIVAVLMETGYDAGIASLVAISDGGASLYFSTGTMIIGGGQHQSVSSAALQLIAQTSAALSRFSPVASYPSPERGQTRIYVVTTKGVLAADAPEAELAQGSHTLSPLYVQGFQVIDAIRRKAQ